MRNVPWTTASAWTTQFQLHRDEILKIPGVGWAHMSTYSTERPDGKVDSYISLGVKHPIDLESVVLEAQELSDLPAGVLVAIRDGDRDGPEPKTFPRNAFELTFSSEFDASAVVNLSGQKLLITASNFLDVVSPLLAGLADAVEEGKVTRTASYSQGDGVQGIEFGPLQVEISPRYDGYWLTVNRIDGTCLGSAHSIDLRLAGVPVDDSIENLLAARSVQLLDDLNL